MRAFYEVNVFQRTDPTEPSAMNGLNELILKLRRRCALCVVRA